MKELVITRRNGDKYTTVVDDQDAHLLTQYTWQVCVKFGRPYVARRTQDNKRRYLHQDVVGPVPKGLYIDHISGGSLNNQRYNLRVVPDGFNVQNSKMFSTNKSGYRGVSWQRKAKRWEAYITFQRKKYFLGLHATKADAARAYDEAARRYFGAGARTNFKAA